MPSFCCVCYSGPVLAKFGLPLAPTYYRVLHSKLCCRTDVHRGWVGSGFSVGVGVRVCASGRAMG